MLKGNLICINNNDIHRRIDQLRNRFESVWSKDTAHHSVYSLPKERLTPSAGQCFVTSWLLKEYLQSESEFNNIFVCRGTLRHRDNNIIDNHCWVEGRINNRNIIFDLTQDQATSNRIYIVPEDDCYKYGFIYIKQYIFDMSTSIKPEALQRVRTLKDRMGWSFDD